MDQSRGSDKFLAATPVRQLPPCGNEPSPIDGISHAPSGVSSHAPSGVISHAPSGIISHAPSGVSSPRQSVISPRPMPVPCDGAELPGPSQAVTRRWHLTEHELEALSSLPHSPRPSGSSPRTTPTQVPRPPQPRSLRRRQRQSAGPLPGIPDRAVRHPLPPGPLRDIQFDLRKLEERAETQREKHGYAGCGLLHPQDQTTPSQARRGGNNKLVPSGAREAIPIQGRHAARPMRWHPSQVCPPRHRARGPASFTSSVGNSPPIPRPVHCGGVSFVPRPSDLSPGPAPAPVSRNGTPLTDSYPQATVAFPAMQLQAQLAHQPSTSDHGRQRHS